MEHTFKGEGTVHIGPVPDTPQELTVPDLMEQALQTFKARGKIYGDNFRRFGPVMQALFPDGLMLKTADDWNRMGVFFQMISKLSRYSNNFNIGHIDSVHDTGVYAFMLELLDHEAEMSRGDDTRI